MCSGRGKVQFPLTHGLCLRRPIVKIICMLICSRLDGHRCRSVRIAGATRICIGCQGTKLNLTISAKLFIAAMQWQLRRWYVFMVLMFFNLTVSLLFAMSLLVHPFVLYFMHIPKLTAGLECELWIRSTLFICPPSLLSSIVIIDVSSRSLLLTIWIAAQWC